MARARAPGSWPPPATRPASPRASAWPQSPGTCRRGWPREGNTPLKHDPTLSDEELAAIQDWVTAGGPLDVDPDTRVEAAPAEGPELRTDLELQIPEPYTGSVDKENDYRCFTMDPGLTEPAAITGYQFQPDQLPIVHHALTYRVRAGAAEALAEAEARDPEPGWECFGGINVGGAGVSPSGRGGGQDLLMGWAPGQPPVGLPRRAPASSSSPATCS